MHCSAIYKKRVSWEEVQDHEMLHLAHCSSGAGHSIYMGTYIVRSWLGSCRCGTSGGESGDPIAKVAESILKLGRTTKSIADKMVVSWQRMEGLRAASRKSRLTAAEKIRQGTTTKSSHNYFSSEGVWSSGGQTFNESRTNERLIVVPRAAKSEFFDVLQVYTQYNNMLRGLPQAT